MAGDATSLALLLDRHRAGTQAVALGLLGYGPDAEDAVQDAMLERRAQRDWIWRALGELSEPLRLVTLLRYFSDVSSYEQIHAVRGAGGDRTPQQTGHSAAGHSRVGA
jgi:DNA-directed RNA polymerase specialized sigma24 family protein